MNEELNYLLYTINKFEEVIDDSKLKLKNIKQLYGYNYEIMLREKLNLENKIQTMERLKNKPYFARIDFENSKIKEKCYIGKVGVQDYDNNIITVDWRAPISSLYYDSNIGPCSYVSPDGVVEGNLSLKREYTIENGVLIEFNDVDTVLNDDILKPYLSVSADKRLKNIISTIQSDQNKIIRETIDSNLVVQGVAGSGKTTVALHRIAYLVYNNRDRYQAKDYMVIGPNKFFVNYISNVLPDLEVNDVAELTLEQVFEKYMGEKFLIYNNLDKIINNDSISQIKSSLEIKNEIDKYFNDLKVLPLIDLQINSEKIISISEIKKIYEEVNIKYYKSIKSRIDRLMLLINKYIGTKREKIVANLIKKSASKETISEFKNNFNKHLKNYFKVLNIKPQKIYIDTLKKLGIDSKNIANNSIEVEDIPSLLYIKYLFSGNDVFDNYRHIVIDEAQDYGEFTFYILKKIFKNATFSIYGDIAQSLYSYRSINNWECLNDLFKNLKVLKLEKSYRTTIEIMTEANKINKKLNLTEAIPVIRHGDNVEYTNTKIIDLINRLKQKYESIAIITKTKEEAFYLYTELISEIELNLISENDINYSNGINILPSYLSKGLEFDSVIIVDNFDKDRIEDLKLLYVAMTRALHKLCIINNTIKL